MRKQTFCICVNKGADQLGSTREADERLCFATLIVKFLYFLSKISSLKPSSVLVQLGFCRTCPETTLLVFLLLGSSNSVSSSQHRQARRFIYLH